MFDATFFEDDDETPFFGVGDGSGGVLEADFSTDPDHPRPYLGEVKNWSATEIDFPAGSSTLGGVTLEFIDKRLDPADQRTGIVTSRAGDLNGKRCLLRRLHPTLGMVTAFNGVVQTSSMGGSPEGLVTYTVQLRDIRERERRQPIFTSNYVLFGEDGKDGPAIDYGALPGGGHMIDGVGPYRSIVAGGISHFERGIGSGEGFAFGEAVISPSLAPALKGLGWPTQDADGLWYHRDVQIRWRPKDSGGSWIVLRDMPRLFYQSILTLPNLVISIPGLTVSAPTIYFGSFDEYEIPETGEEVEFQILAVDITEDTPFWWDGGTAGDLLKEIYDGAHNREIDAPRIQYNAAAMAAFRAATPAVRMKLTEPVDNLRDFVEQQIYAPFRYAPGFDVEKKVRPVSWDLPANTTALPIVNALSIVPVASWEHGADSVINTVEFSYIREHLDPLKTIMKEVSTKSHWWQVWNPTKQVEVTDPDDLRSPWQRVVETTVHDDGVEAISLATFGAKKITYESLLLRTTANVDGRPAGGDAINEVGALIARAARAAVLKRFSFGAPKVVARVLASDPNVQDLLEGDWVRLRGSYLPDLTSGERGLAEYAQIVAISDENPAERVLTLVLSRVPDETDVDDETGTGTAGTDCLSGTGGIAYPAAGGKTIRVLRTPGRHQIVNACDTPVDVDLVIVAGGGGGGGGAGSAGGGGGAGGVLGVESTISVTIPASSSVPVDVGAGGAANTNGEDTIVWLDRVTGAILDPDVDDPDDAYRALGGGHGSTGDGAEGGSGGGGGGSTPTSGPHSHAGGNGTSGQGSAGGGGGDEGGIATCKTAAGGGGGSFAGAGQAGSPNSSFPPAESEAGVGGPSFLVDDWGIVLGGGGNGAVHDVPGSLGDLCSTAIENGADGEGGWGYGGGGGFSSGSAGGAGGLGLRYAGARLKLVPPEITSSTTTDQNQQEICVEGGDWPPGAVDGVEVRVEYAIGDTEPAADSGDWLVAGVLSAPGCVTTPPVPTGAKVWSRAVAQAPKYLPSDPGDSVSGVTPGTPGLLAHQLTITDGVARLTWLENAYCTVVRVRWLVHQLGASTDRPLPDSQVLDASDREFVIPDAVPRGSFITVDVECYPDEYLEDEDQGRIYRLSEENEAPLIATSSESIDFFEDVELADPGGSGEVEILSPDEYGVFRNRAVRLDEWAEPEDNTDLNASTVRHGLMPKLSGDGSKYIGGDGAEHDLPSDGFTEVVAASDQDVTNTSTPQNDSELSFPVVAGAIYEIDLRILYAGSDTNGFRYGVSWPSSLGEGRFYGTLADTGSGAYESGQMNSGETSGFLGGFASYTVGTSGSGTYNVHMLEGRIMLRVNSNGTFHFLFSNKDAAVGRTSRRLAGSLLRYRRLV